MKKLVILAALVTAFSSLAARPVPGTCTKSFQSLKHLGGNAFGQDRCKDGLVTHI